MKLNLIYLYVLLGILCVASQSQAAPDDRGSMGGFIALGLGGQFALATDVDGTDTANSAGFANHLTFGEEVWPNLFLGLNLGFNQGSTSESPTQEASLFFFGLDIRYRLTGSQKKRASGLLFLTGIGLGAGGVSVEAEDGGTEGVSGGSVWKAGLGYEIPFTSKGRGFTITPYLTYYHLRQQMDSKISMQLLSAGVEFMWSAGRQNKAADKTSTRIDKKKQ